MKIGFGYDIHPFKKGKGVMLGGIFIQFKKRLKGHSDGDVVIHAIMDSLLGAMGKGDIGQYFSPKDHRLKNISSLILLQEVNKIVKENSYRINNIDVMVVAEEPKLSEYYISMKNSISQALNIESNCINIKTTTSEGLGPIGRGKGIEAFAISLLEEDK